jgi:hypothetical protein
MTRQRWSVYIWAVVLLVLALRATLSKKVDGVYPIFSTAGRHWLAGETAYGPPKQDIDRYRYTPTVTAFFAATTVLPDRVACLLWRGLNVAVFLAGVAAWCRWRRIDFSAAAVLALPLAIGGLNNAQVNALDVGLLLLAAVAFGRDRLTLAAVLLSIPVLFKGYPIAMGLLLCLIEPRRFTPRLGVCLLVGGVVPFLCQRPAFVWQEYTTYLSVVRVDDRTQWDIVAGYRDLHMLLRRFGVPLSLAEYRLVEIVLGAGCAAIVLFGRRKGWDRHAAVTAATSLGLCWMTLAGPATESCTYVVISPVLAAAVLTVRQRPGWQKGLVAASFVMFTIAAASVWFPGWIAHPIQATAIQPLAALILTLYVVVECVRPPTGLSGDHFFSVLGKSASSSRTAA